LALLVAACASAHLQQVLPAQPIICVAGADCDTKWSRAKAWIASNSTRRIEVQTDTMVQTAQPLRAEPAPAFTITKVARGEGRYEITFNGGCGNQPRCVPAVPELRAHFTAFVLGEEAPAPVSSQ
jgi:hypothetical protein